MKSSSTGWYKVLYIVLAVLYLFAGIALVANPGYFAGSMIWMIGWLGVFYGVMVIVSYFLHSHFRSVWVLVFGIVLVILGIAVMTHIFAASIALGAVTGIWFIIAGVFKSYESFVIKDAGFKVWWAVLLLGLCNLVLGIILIANLSATATILTLMIGVNLIVNGVSDFTLGLSL